MACFGIAPHYPRHSIFVTDRGQGTPILLLHGHPSSCHDWKGVCDRLDSKARLIAFDMVGYGFSEKPEAFSYSIFQQADVAQGLVEQLGFVGSARRQSRHQHERS